MVRGRNHVRHNPPQAQQCPFCYERRQSPYYLDIHIIKAHLQMTCRLCGLVREGYFRIVFHFVVVHMRRNVSGAENLCEYMSMLRDIPIAEFAMGDLEEAAYSQPGSILQFILNIPDFMPLQSTSNQALESTEADEDTESDGGDEGSDGSDA